MIDLEKGNKVNDGGTRDGAPSWGMVEAMLKDAKANALDAFERSARNYCGHGLERFPRGRTLQVGGAVDYPWTVVGVREDGDGGYAVLTQEPMESEATEIEPEVLDTWTLVHIGRHMDEEVESLKRAAVDDLKGMLERKSRRGTTVGDFVDRHYNE